MTRKNFIDLAELIIAMRENDKVCQEASYFVKGYISSMLEREKNFDKIKFAEYIVKNTK